MSDRLKTWLALAAFLLPSTEVIAAERERFITYTIKGGMAVMDVRVEIEQTTHAVRVQETRMRGEKETIDYQTVLSEGEGAEFEARIQKAGFFSNSAKKKNHGLKGGHAGISTLMVSLDGKSHTRTYRYEEHLAPVTELLWQLIYQARAVHSLRPDGSARLSGGNVLQPAAMKAPLMKYLKTHKDWGNVKSALESLARFTSAEEFHDFVVTGLKPGAAERDTLLSIVGTHPFRGNIPKGHLEALLPVFLDYIKTVGIPNKFEGVLHRDRTEKMQIEANAFDRFLQVLGYWHYEDAIPVLIEGFEKHTRQGVTPSQTPLSSMGLAGLKAIFPFLSSPLPVHRLNATELLVIASRSGPNCGFTRPVSEAEYQKMMPYFETKILPKLATIAKEDSKNRNQAKAQEAINEIQIWLAK